MNPFPMVRAALARNPLTATLFVILIALAVALSTAISVQERAMRQGSARAADRFDLIVAAPGSQTDLLMSSVYLRPRAVELLPGALAAEVLADPAARFAAPLAFGDSMGGSAVVGTSAAFVDHLSGGLAAGRVFETVNEAVVGALVGAELGAHLRIRHGDADDVSGGMDADSFAAAGEDHDHDHDHGGDHAHEDHGHLHDDVVVTGRMQPTGTPWDNAVIVPVEYIWLAHAMGSGHAPGDERIGPPWQAEFMPGLPAIVVAPDSVSSAYGMRARYRTAQSTAFFPAETLVEVYEVTGQMARVMSVLTLTAQVLVAAAILTGLLAVLDLQRRRFAMLRALGAPGSYVFLSVWLYVGGMILAGVVAGLPLGLAASAIASRMIAQQTGVAMSAYLGAPELAAAGVFVLAGLVLALIPAIRLYRCSAVDALR